MPEEEEDLRNWAAPAEASASPLASPHSCPCRRAYPRARKLVCPHCGRGDGDSDIPTGRPLGPYEKVIFRYVGGATADTGWGGGEV